MVAGRREILQECLEDLLEQGLDPNITSQQVMSKVPNGHVLPFCFCLLGQPSVLNLGQYQVGGTPLYLAAKLNVPQAVRLLCLHGASMVQVFRREELVAVSAVDFG